MDNKYTNLRKHTQTLIAKAIKLGVSLLVISFLITPSLFAQVSGSVYRDYNSDGFTIKEHTSLFEKLVELDKKDIRFSLSNSKVAMVEQYFQEGFQCQEVKARRAINSKNPESTTTEVIYYS